MKEYKFKEISKKELKKFRSLNSKIISKRGEIINLIIEIESLLDEIIINHFVKKDKVSKFFDMFLWEDFRLSTKIRMFGEIELPESMKEIQKYTQKALEKISSIRNKYAHRLNLVIIDKVYLIDKNHKSVEINEKEFKNMIEDIKSIRGTLKMILFNQVRRDMPKTSKLKMILMNLKDISK